MTALTLIHKKTVVITEAWQYPLCSFYMKSMKVVNIILIHVESYSEGNQHFHSGVVHAFLSLASFQGSSIKDTLQRF